MEFKDASLGTGIKRIKQDLPLPVEIPENIKIHEVGMNKFKRLDIPASDYKIYYLGTVARSGCDSVLVWKIDPEGKDEMLLTHYPPSPAKKLDEHLKILNQFSPRGEGTIKAVYLTFGTEKSVWTHKIEKAIMEITGSSPDVVRISNITADTIQKEMKYNDLNYQLIAIRGVNGKPNARKIEVPVPKGNVYLKEF